MVGIMITNGGTHPPEKHAEHAVQELLPVTDDMSAVRVGDTHRMRDRLRPHFVSALRAVRDHEADALSKLSGLELSKLVDLEMARHDDRDALHTLVNMHAWCDKVLHPYDHVDAHIGPIYDAASNWVDSSDPDQMRAAIHRVLSDRVMNVQHVERIHRATTRGVIQ